MPQADSLHKFRVFLAAIWAGSAVMVAVTATLLNRVLTDRVDFGNTVSVLFRAEALVGLACGFALLALTWSDRLLDARKRRTLLSVTLLMLSCILGYFVLQPMMAALREAAGPAGVMATAARQQFGMLHGVSMLLYLVQTLLAVFLLFKIRK